MSRITDREFFRQEPEKLAKDLIGKVICHKIIDKDGKPFIIRERIKTTEAYTEKDESIDNNRSRTPTSQVLDGGHLHHVSYGSNSTRGRMDIVASIEGVAASVLIAELDTYDGPQKSVWAMYIDDKDYDGVDLVSSKELWIEDDGTTAVLKKPEKRKGIEDDKLLRFSAESFKFA